MNPLDEIFVKTNANLNGHWIFEGLVNESPTRIIIRITNDKLVINWWFHGILKDSLEESARKTAWFGDYLRFMGSGKYYTKYADETKMVFGEMKTDTGLIGEVVWEHEFVRLND